MGRRTPCVLLLSCAASVWPAPAARAAVEASAAMEPTEIGVRVDRVAYRLTLKAGDQETHVAVRLRLPTWGRVGDPIGRPAGLVGGAPSVEGPGHLDGLIDVAPLPIPLLATDAVCYRGLSELGGLSGVNVTLPANSSTTLTFAGTVAPVLWPDSDVRVGFQIAERAAGDLTDPAPDTPVILPDPPRITRPLGTRLTVRVGSGAADAFAGSIARVGQAVAIAGATDPPLPDQLIVLSAPQRFATATTDRIGRFSYTWVPKRSGRFRISAAVTPPDAARAGDNSCAQTATVTRADGSVSPDTTGAQAAAPARVTAERMRMTAAGSARIPLACDQQAACRGRLVLRSRGRTLGQRDFLLAAGARAELRVPLSRGARQQVRRRGRLRLLAVLFPGRYRHVTLRP